MTLDNEQPVVKLSTPAPGAEVEAPPADTPPPPAADDQTDGQHESEELKGLKLSMTGVLEDFRHRATSFDLHNLGSNKSSILARILRRKSAGTASGTPPAEKAEKAEKKSTLFRSKSDSNVKTVTKKQSPTTSPTASPGAPRRRFVRVVRDSASKGEEYVNPHVVRKYNSGFFEKRSSSLDESMTDDKPLPYTVEGSTHTILKKHNSADDHNTSMSPNGTKTRHAMFKEEVEVVEYDIKGKCKSIMNEASVIQARLHDHKCDVSLKDELFRLYSDKVSQCDEYIAKKFQKDKAAASLEPIDEKRPAKDTNVTKDSPKSAETEVEGAIGGVVAPSDVDISMVETTSTTTTTTEQSDDKENCAPTNTMDTDPFLEVKRHIIKGQISLEEERASTKKSKIENGMKTGP